MSTLAKILVVVNLVLAAAFVGSVSTYLGHQDHWKKKHDDQGESLNAEIERKQTIIDDRDGTIQTLTAAKTAAERESTETKAALTKLETSHRDLQTAYADKDAQLTKATQALSNISETASNNITLINQLKQGNGELEQALTAMRQARDAAVEQVNRLSSQLSNETANGQKLKTQVADLQDTLASTANALAAARASGGTAGLGTPQPAHSGRVLAADGQHVVISLGTEDGVKIGYRYTISRGSDYVAEVEITDTQAKKSAGRVIRSTKQSDVQIGDNAFSG